MIAQLVLVFVSRDALDLDITADWSVTARYVERAGHGLWSAPETSAWQEGLECGC